MATKTKTPTNETETDDDFESKVADAQRLAGSRNPSPFDYSNLEGDAEAEYRTVIQDAASDGTATPTLVAHTATLSGRTPADATQDVATLRRRMQAAATLMELDLSNYRENVAAADAEAGAKVEAAAKKLTETRERHRLELRAAEREYTEATSQRALSSQTERGKRQEAVDELATTASPSIERDLARAKTDRQKAIDELNRRMRFAAHPEKAAADERAREDAERRIAELEGLKLDPFGGMAWTKPMRVGE